MLAPGNLGLGIQRRQEPSQPRAKEVLGMNTPAAALNRKVPGNRGEPRLWLHSKQWDLLYITGSSVLVVLPLMLYAVVGHSAIFVNLFIAGVIGGPHMYATFFRTLLDPSFRQRHRLLVIGSLGIPVLVVTGAVWAFQLLMTLFFFWASMHILHQIAYILECYERKQHGHLQHWSLIIDYAVVFSSLYPFASYRFIHDEFYIGETLLLYPNILKAPIICYTISGFFALAFLLFIIKTMREIQQGTVHYPKILLMVTTIGLALFITSYNGNQLEIAFQGFNTWHSFQYLALTWYINTLRKQRGTIEARCIPWLSNLGASRFSCFYGLNVACTLGALLLIGIVFRLSGLTFEHSYYIVVLSFLLIHYCHDHVLFTQFEDLVPQAEGAGERH
jgi:hypothetical protein